MINISQPAACPKPLDGPRRPNCTARSGCDAPEERTAVHATQAKDDIAYAALPSGRRILRDDEEDETGSESRRRPQKQEQRAPIGQLQQGFTGSRGWVGPEPVEHDEEAFRERDPLFREPLSKALEPGHERAGHPEPDQNATNRQGEGRTSQTEHDGARGGNQQQHRLDPPWAETVEHDAKGDLGESKREKIGGSEQPQIGGGQAECRGQVGGNQRIDGAEQVREEVSGSKRQEYDYCKCYEGVGSFKLDCRSSLLRADPVKK